MEYEITKAKNILEFTKQESTCLIYCNLDLFCEYQLAPKYLEYYKNKKTYEIKNLDDYIDFLMLRKQNRYREEEPYINREVKEQFHNTYSELCNIFNNYVIGDAITFINENYKLICEDLLMAIVTFDFIKDKFNGVNVAVLKEITNKHPDIWYSNLKQHINYIKKNPIIAEIIFSEENLALIDEMDTVLFNCIIALKKHKQFSDITERCEAKVIRQMEILESQVTEDNLLLYHNTYRTFCNKLKDIKHKNYSEKNEILLELNKKLQKQIAKKGNQHILEIKGEDIEKNFDNREFQFQILSLTHQMDQSISEIKHIFDIEMPKEGNSKTNLIDSFHYGHSINNYFSLSKKYLVEIINFRRISFLSHFLLVDERIENLFARLRGFIESICKKLNVDETEYDFISDLCVLEIAIYNAINNESNSEDVIDSALLNYSVIMYGCSFIEKILRAVYIAENKEEIFIDLNSLTLGDLLDYEKNQIITDILGYHQTRCLRYLLCMDDNEVGQNLRNKVAHFKGITIKDFNVQNSKKVIWLLIGVINSLAIHYCME